MSEAQLIRTFPAAMRLALAYATPASRSLYVGLFALDCHLAALVRNAREPLLGQIRLAWWRDRLGEDVQAWPSGSPVLAALAEWPAGRGRLQRVVDGWEELLGAGSLDPAAALGHAEGRAHGFIAIAEASDGIAGPDIVQAGEAWALADLANHLGSGDERRLVHEMLEKRRAAPAVRLPHLFRPLAVLRACAQNADTSAPVRLGLAVRAGLLGR